MPLVSLRKSSQTCLSWFRSKYFARRLSILPFSLNFLIIGSNFSFRPCLSSLLIGKAKDRKENGGPTEYTSQSRLLKYSIERDSPGNNKLVN